MAAQDMNVFPTDASSPASSPATAKALSLREIFTRRVVCDHEGKGLSLALASWSYPMRSWWLATLGFMAAFTSWFALTPLLKKTIRPDLGLSDEDLSNSDIANVSSTVIFRVLVGPLVDKLGPSRVMALILVSGSIPLGLSGLLKNGAGLITLRAFIGILGATFVPCQAWTTALFNKRIVGTANAVAGGWGNMGAGVTSLLMPQVYAMFVAFGLASSIAWRISVLIPVLICICVAMMCWFLGDDRAKLEYGEMSTAHHKPVTNILDTSLGSTVVVDPPEEAHIPKLDKGGVVDNRDRDNHNHHHLPQHSVGGCAAAANRNIFSILITALSNPNVLILMVSYACCFGVELSVDSVIGNYFIKHFGVNQQIGGLFGALFGLLNIFSRATGGITSDFIAVKYGLPGRIFWMALLFLLSASSIIGFSFANSIGTATFVMILFSYGCQAGTGSVFAIVPFLGSYMGAASGLIGAGGNIGGALFNVLFRIYIDDQPRAFQIIGAVVAVGGFLLAFLLRIDGQSAWSILCRV
ncbi:major facilitator superfamily domain-containing protein [Cladochytrium replicatum]|nr:major facilitator superfamily domain-containing protein [Cladochytrium replicatum]